MSFLDPAAVLLPGFMPGSKRFVACSGGDVAVRDISGPSDAAPVLLLHGWTATADLNWSSTYGAISAHHPVLAPDHRGHGRGIRSTESFTIAGCADDAAEVLRSCASGPAIVAGYSMGGPVALEMARRHPELVSGLVLCATAARFGPFPVEQMALNAIGAIGRIVHRAEVVAKQRIGFAMNLGEMLEAAAAIGMFDARSWLSGIRVPAVVVCTEHDHLVPTADQVALAKALGAPVVSFRAGHDAPVHHGSAFAAALLDALALLTPAASCCL